MHFLFPGDYFEQRRPDALFAAQAEALRAAGHAIHCVDADSPSGRVLPPVQEALLYRGYMLDAAGYAALEARISAQGARLLIPQAMYLRCHHLPNWYPLLQTFTPETRVYTDAGQALAGLDELFAAGWEGVFIKDYVKSLKTATGSIAASQAEAAAILGELAHLRDGLEGGVCLRRVEDLDPASEQRYFVWHDKPYAPGGGSDFPAPLLACLGRIDSRFYSVDIACNRQGQPRLVEIGDGQVSDLVGWDPERFAAIFSPA